MEDELGLGFLMAYIGVVAVFGLLIYLVIGYSLGKLFEKAGKPLWAGFVPIYNMVVMLEVIGRPVWWIALFLLAFIPIIGSIVVFLVALVIWIEFAKSYGKDLMWGVLLAFFSIIVLPIMAFSGDTQYVGPVGNNDPNPLTAFSSGGSKPTGGA